MLKKFISWFNLDADYGFIQLNKKIRDSDNNQFLLTVIVSNRNKYVVEILNAFTKLIVTKVEEK